MTSPDLAKSYAFNEATNVRPFSLTQSRTNYRVKVYNQQLFGSVSPRERESVKFNHEQQRPGTTGNLVDIVKQNIRNKFSGTSSFKNTIDRGIIKSKARLTLRDKIQMKPSVAFYDINHEYMQPKMRNLNLSLEKLRGRKDIKLKDDGLPFKSLLNSFDYSSFKEGTNVIDISKV